MKHSSIFLGVLALVAHSFTPCAAQTRQELLRSVQAPGVVPVGDSLFMDEAEVANIHWLEYLHCLRKDSSAAVYQAALPDTTVWSAHRLSRPDTAADVFLNYYLRYPGFRYFPVVGVTQAQAAAYCRWRSAMVNKLFRTSPQHRRRRRKLRDYDVKMTFRLPAAAEWESAASGRLDPVRHPYGYEHPPRHVPKRKRVKEAPTCYHATAFPAGALFFLTDANVLDRYYYQGAAGQPPVYFRCESPPVPPNPGTRLEDINPDGSVKSRASDGVVITEYIYSSPPNGYGLYNMIGNVAELTTTPGEAKGGSFVHTMTASRIQAHQSYDGPQQWLGFRCACVVELRRKSVSK